MSAPMHFPQSTTVQLIDHQTLEVDFAMDPTRRPPFVAVDGASPYAGAAARSRPTPNGVGSPRG